MLDGSLNFVDDSENYSVMTTAEVKKIRKIQVY